MWVLACVIVHFFLTWNCVAFDIWSTVCLSIRSLRGASVPSLVNCAYYCYKNEYVDKHQWLSFQCFWMCNKIELSTHTVILYLISTYNYLRITFLYPLYSFTILPAIHYTVLIFHTLINIHNSSHHSLSFKLVWTGISVCFAFP